MSPDSQEFGKTSCRPSARMRLPQKRRHTNARFASFAVAEQATVLAHSFHPLGLLPRQLRAVLLGRRTRESSFASTHKKASPSPDFFWRNSTRAKLRITLNS
jgi:hypothetical protein